jgi:hypothetical protein
VPRTGVLVKPSDAILLVALARYADSCPSGVLHSDCPFAVSTGDGRSCNTECRALLTVLHRPQLAERPGSRAFDAREIFLAARTISYEPSRQWPVAALLYDLERVCRSAAFSIRGALDLRRYVMGTTALAHLAWRGVNPDALLRFGFGRELAAAIDVYLARSRLQGRASEGNWLDEVRWYQLYEKIVDDDASRSETPPTRGFSLSPRFQDVVISWLNRSPPAQVLTWASPPDSWETSAVGSGETEAFEYRWLVERSTKTYLTDWSDDSLRCEYRYLHDRWEPSFLTRHVLAERLESAEDVSEEIARRVVHGSRAQSAAVGAITAQALESIRGGRRDTAAALFSAARALDNTNAIFANNLGFCLLPDQPAKALVELESARRLGQSDLVVDCNVIVANILLGRRRQAIDLAEKAYRARTAIRRAYLWDLTNTDEPRLVESDPLEYLCRTARDAAATLLDVDLESVWRARLTDAESSNSADLRVRSAAWPASLSSVETDGADR